MRTLLLALLITAAPVAAQDNALPKPASTPSSAPQIIEPLVSSVDGLPISALPPQRLPAKGCAAFLWTRTPSMALVAMATTDPASLRLTIDGKVTDLPISAQNGIGGLGYSQITEYRGKGTTATLQIVVKTDASMPKSGSISDATLRIDRAGRASVVIPVAGAIGCA
ncbi:hypothetical protein [Sphingomonas asaccharolytica]|uniref:hypothetical protein n=1 Tax=Sphingomonas asaccharolytica TaxID=40681 RepID=UPI00082A0425|nr:hypothetical protein [Sphingomonas asaccharolytica]